MSTLTWFGMDWFEKEVDSHELKPFGLAKKL